MKRLHIAIAAIILFEILMLFIGCQGGGNNPMSPAPVPGPDQQFTDGVLDENTIRNADSAGLWGIYRISYDPYTHTAEAVPLRGPSFAFNVVKFLQPPAGNIDGVMINIIDDFTFMSDGRIDIRVILDHPFPGLDVFTGFDVCGIFLTESTIASPANSSIRYADPSTDPSLLNPDGYTRWMNPAEFLTGDVFGYEEGIFGTIRSESSENSGFVAGATVNPYKYFANGLGPDDELTEWLKDPGNIDERGIFRSGSSCSRDYNLQFPYVGNQPVFEFNYAVLANWMYPGYDEISDPIHDFPPGANAQYPLHIFVTDNSAVYYTPEESGGTLRFEIEVFDWGAMDDPGGVPKQVSKFTIWSNDNIIPGGYAEIMDTEVEWNSGFTASSSVAHVELTGMSPQHDGDATVWIEIESTDPWSYDQGFGADVPSDPIAAYMRVPVWIEDCPQAFMYDMETNSAGSDSKIDDILITGEDFVPGEELGVWLEEMITGESAGENDGFKVYGTDVQYHDANTITADFDFSNAPVGSYGMGCVNGCGIITQPEENSDKNVENFEVKVVPTVPFEIELSTGRTGTTASSLTDIYVHFVKPTNADYVKVYAKGYDPCGALLWSSKLGQTTSNSYKITLDDLPLYDCGIIEVWLTAGGLLGNVEYESFPSRSVWAHFQGFESTIGCWHTPSKEAYYLRFLRSSISSSFDGYWGLKAYGQVPFYPSLWIAFTTPPIPEIADATHVDFEFVHTSHGIADSNGYQVGWCAIAPTDYDNMVQGYNPILSASYGYDYNDFSCTALQTEFGVSATEDNNFNYTDPSSPSVWKFSGFDMSEILGDNVNNFLMIGFAGNTYDTFMLNIDEVAVLIY